MLNEDEILGLIGKYDQFMYNFRVGARHEEITGNEVIDEIENLEKAPYESENTWYLNELSDNKIEFRSHSYEDPETGAHNIPIEISLTSSGGLSEAKKLLK